MDTHEPTGTRIYTVEPYSADLRVAEWTAASWEAALAAAQEVVPAFDYVQAVETDGGGRVLRVQSFPEGLLLAFPADDLE